MYEPGDIIFYPITKRSGWFSKLIGLLQFIFRQNADIKKKGYSHVALVDFDTNLKLEMVYPRSVITKIESIEHRPYVIGKVNVSTKDKIQAVQWAHNHLGERYFLEDYLKAFLGNEDANGFCSHWVKRAYLEKEGNKINLYMQKGALTTPDELACSKHITMEN